MTNFKTTALALVAASALLASGLSLATSAATVTPAPTTIANVTAEAPDAKKEAGVFGKRLAELNLNETQKMQVKEIFQKYQPQLAELKVRDEANQNELAHIPVTGDVAAVAKKIGNDETKRIEIRSDLRKEIYAVLNPEQKAKVDSWMQERVAARAEKQAAKAAAPKK
jgi:protein CpxP